MLPNGIQTYNVTLITGGMCGKVRRRPTLPPPLKTTHRQIEGHERILYDEKHQVRL